VTAEEVRSSIAVICSRYPAVSHAFLVNEVRALREQALDVHTFTIRRPAADVLRSGAYREEAERTFAVLPPRPLRLFASHVRAALSRPLRYLACLSLSLRLTSGGPRHALWRAFYFAEAVLVWDECRRRGVRHLHAHFANVGSDVAMLAAHLGGAGWSWSFTMHGCTELFDGTKHRLPEKLRRADVAICNSHFTRSQLMRLAGHEHWHKLRVVRCGVDSRHFTPAERRPAGGPLRILTVARLVRAKGHAVLLEALSSLRDEGIETVATFVGDGPERERLERLACELRLDVRFTGAVGQDELPDYYNDAQVFCLPTLDEGLGVVLLEAMASGLPAVSSRLMGVPEVIRDGESGLLVPPGRPDELANALRRLAQSPELRERMGCSGRAIAVEEFDIDEAAVAVAGCLGLQGARVESRSDTAAVHVAPVPELEDEQVPQPAAVVAAAGQVAVDQRPDLGVIEVAAADGRRVEQHIARKPA
jgi:glycosyltransferase involved in cell wall biosynthesis